VAALYYTRNGPFGDVLRAVEATGPGRRVAVVGLGIGSLACTAAPGTRLVFFELNPGVVRLARDTSLFRTLSACAPDAPVHLGDARLTLERVREKYHLLVLDAFSSDAIPTHLLTREAFALYRERLEAGGVIAYHVSNRFLDLAPVLGAMATEAGWVAVHAQRPDAPDLGPLPSPTTVIALAADSVSPRGLVASRYWQWVDQPGRPWTDDWSPLASALRLNRATVVGR
jgi:spermidine synthase